MHPIPMSERISVVYADKGSLEQDGHRLVLVDKNATTVIPVAKTTVVLLGNGTTVTHAAIRLCAEEGCLLLWVGESGVRLYAAGNPRSSSDNLVRQACLFSDSSKRLEIARRIFRLMFDEDAPAQRSVEQLRGLEGGRVKQLYADFARKHEVEWLGKEQDLSVPINAALAGVNAALYGVTEAVILALGYSPSIGFVHAGDSRSFVFDVADTVKFRFVAPLAFELAKAGGENMEHRSRTACRDLFVRENLMDRLVTNIQEILRD